MSKIFISDVASATQLEQCMPTADREAYRAFRHLKSEAAFIGRVFIVYQPQPLHLNGTAQNPRILGVVKVTDFFCDNVQGTVLTLEDIETGEVQDVGHVPERCFDYDFFVAAPTYTLLRFDAVLEDDQVKRSLLFGILIKAMHRADHLHVGVTYAETPNVFRDLYPEVTLPSLH